MTAAGWSNPGYARVADLLAAHAGLWFSAGRRGATEMRIAQAMQRAGVEAIEDYSERLHADPQTFDDLIAAITVKESYFFRDASQFKVLREHILPTLRRMREPDHRFRVWSAGCAGGQEAYSLAILFEEEGFGERVGVLASDISRDGLTETAEASYTSWSFRTDERHADPRYFRRRGNHFDVVERLKRRVTVQYHNLSLDTYPSWSAGIWGMDLILCRNVLIYFGAETVERVGRRLLACLADGGWLVLGASDPPLPLEPPYEAVGTPAGVVYRRVEGGAARPLAAPRPWPSAEPKVDAELVPEPPRAAPESRGVGRPPSPASDAERLGAAREALARRDHARALELARDLDDEVEACALVIRSLSALGDQAAAERAAVAAVKRYPLAPEPAFLYGALLVERGRHDEAARSFRRVLYLDPALGVAHLALGAVLWRLGDLKGARRAYRNGHAFFAQRPDEEVVRLADGERAGRLADAAAAHVALLDARREEAA